MVPSIAPKRTPELIVRGVPGKNRTVPRMYMAMNIRGPKIPYEETVSLIFSMLIMLRPYLLTIVNAKIIKISRKMIFI